MTRSRPLAVPALAILGAVAAAVLGLGIVPVLAAAAADPDDDGFGITVTVTAPPATPAPTGGGSGGGGGGGGGGDEDDDDQGEDEDDDLPTEGLPPESILRIGGLSSTPTLSINPFGGAVRMRVTVENVSNSTIELGARAAITGPFGNELDHRVLRVRGLEPGEIRTIDVTLGGAGQWTLVTAHLVLTPPDEVDGIALGPIEREQFLVVFPWLLACLLIAGAATAAIVWLVRGREVGVAAATAEAT